MEDSENNLFRKFRESIVWLGLRSLFGCRLEGATKLPQGVPVVFAGNHVSHYDPFFLWYILYDRLKQTRKGLGMVGWDELARMPVVSVLVKPYLLPVSSRENTMVFRQMLSVLKSGKDISIQCEGHVNRTLGHFHSGAATVSLMSGCPVIPFSLRGAHTLFHELTMPNHFWGNVSMLLHDPIYPQPYLEKYDELRVAAEYMTADVRAAVASGIDYPDGEADEGDVG